MYAFEVPGDVRRVVYFACDPPEIFQPIVFAVAVDVVYLELSVLWHPQERFCNMTMDVISGKMTVPSFPIETTV